MASSNSAVTGQYPATVDQLVTSIRRRAFMPVDGDGAATVDLIQLMNEELPWLVAEILKARQGHFRTSIDVPLVNGQVLYPIQAGAIGAQLEAIIPIDPMGNPIDQPLIEDVVWDGATYQASTQSAYPTRYMWNGNAIKVSPVPSSGGFSLRIFYGVRPSQLVPLAAVYQVTSLTPGGGNVTVGVQLVPGAVVPVATQNPIPAGYVNAAAVDLVKATSNFDVAASSSIVSTTASTTTVSAPTGSGATFTVSLDVAGSITGITVTAGGTSYPSTGSLTITGSGTGATATFTSSGGVIQNNVVVTNPGIGYGALASITWTGLVTGTAAVGDYLCLGGTAPVITAVMPEAFPLYAQYCAMKLLESRTDNTGYQRVKDALGTEMERFEKFLGQRTRYQHEKINGQFGKFRWGGPGRRPWGGWLR